MIYCPLIFQNSCPPLEDKKALIFVEKLKKMQPLKMTFKVNQSPQSRVMIVLCSKFQIWKSHRIDGFLKYLNRFFFFKNLERVKMHSIIKNTYDFFVKLIKNSQFLLKIKKKCNLQKRPLEVNQSPQSRVMSVLCFC